MPVVGPPMGHQQFQQGPGPPGPMMGYGPPPGQQQQQQQQYNHQMAQLPPGQIMGYPGHPGGQALMSDYVESAEKRKDYETLCHIINQWNANRLDLFALSLPNEVRADGGHISHKSYGTSEEY
jgi:hypothetical protein